MRKFLLGAIIACVLGAATACGIGDKAVAAPSGSMVYNYNQYRTLSANATTVVKAAPGLFYGICINTVGASANTISVYDALTATNLVAVFDGTVRGCFIYSAAMLTGITVVSATGTAANFTILYR